MLIKKLLCMMRIFGILAGLQANEYDLIKMAEKFKNSSSLDGYPLGAMLRPYGDGFLWRIPDGPASNRVKLPSVGVKPLNRYKLVMKMEPSHMMKLLFMAYFTDDEGDTAPALHLFTFEDSSAYMVMEKDIIIPENINTLDLEIHLSGAMVKPKSNIGFISELKLVELGPLEFNPALSDFYGKNLLPYSNFNGFELGKKTVADLKLMPFGQKPFDLEIVKSGDSKVLKVNYNPGDYQYVTFFTPELPLFGSAGMIKCRIRGKGKAQLMAWFNRPEIHTIYKHYGFFELTSEWQEISIGVGIDDPLIRKFGLAIACRDNPTEFELSNVEFVLSEIKK